MLYPPIIYNTVYEWVNNNILRLDGVPVVRPFYPGGDYENYDYPEGCVVLDNPPFSILAKIRRFYHSRGIRYFLFAPSLTLANSAHDIPCTYIICGDSITYENGAKISTSFVTNLDCGGTAVWCAGDLSLAIKAANKLRERTTIEKPCYEYPPQVTSPALLQKISKSGVVFKIQSKSISFTNSLDSQKATNKGLFGGGWLLSEKAAAEKAAARQRTYWQLSDREKNIINQLE